MLRFRSVRLLASLTLSGSLLLTPFAPAFATPPKLPTFKALTLVPGDPLLSLRLSGIEKAVDAERQRLHIPGISLAIVKDDKVVYSKGLGLRDVDKKLPVTPDTLFAIGSSSKAFTAMTVMMSAEEGKLALTDPPRKYLSYFKLRDPDADAKMTVSDLLCHRCGLDRTDLAWYTGKLSSEEAIRVAGVAKATAKYGEKFQYQNVMFLTAGQIVGTVQKTPWTDFVTKRIFQPLGMKDSNLSVPKTLRAKDFALGYSYNEDKKTFQHLPMRNIINIAPAGAINSNAKDMAQWVRLMLGGGVYAGKRLISEKSYNALITKHMDIAGPVSYGYGWFLRDWNGHKVVEHGGNIDGFNAQVAFMPDQKLGFVLLTNVSASSLGSYTMNQVWKAFVEVPKKPQEAAPSTTTLASSTPSGPATDPASEAGIYEIPKANFTVTVTLKAGKLYARSTGQPELPLEPLGGRRYKLGSPAPDGFFATFRPAKDDPKQTELFLEQPQGNVVFKKKGQSDYASPITVEDLMQKVIAAVGGEANLRKHQTMVVKTIFTQEKEGLTGEGVTYARAPNAQTEDITMIALGKRIATVHAYFDGSKGGSETSFSLPAPKSEKDLPDAKIAADFYDPLTWKTLFKTVKITGKEKVGEEECYILEKTPEKGSVVKDYISIKSFLLLKRAGAGGFETFSAYRPVDGVLIPFQRIRTQPDGSEIVSTVKEVKFNVRLSDTLFQPKKKG